MIVFCWINGCIKSAILTNAIIITSVTSITIGVLRANGRVNLSWEIIESLCTWGIKPHVTDFLIDNMLSISVAQGFIPAY